MTAAELDEYLAVARKHGATSLLLQGEGQGAPLLKVELGPLPPVYETPETAAAYARNNGRTPPGQPHPSGLVDVGGGIMADPDLIGHEG